MPVSAAKIKANKKWDSKNLDRLSVVLPIGYKDKLRAVAVRDNTSVNNVIKTAVDLYLEEKSE